MKIDRLIRIIIFLLNRKKVSASELSDKFEVSVRTIQRDIDSLCMAGIPITSVQGVNGGYGILNTYTINRQIGNIDDFYFIITALKSLSTVYENNNLLNTLEKTMSIFSRGNNLSSNKNDLYIDFSAFKEPKNIKYNFINIEKAIKSYRIIEFDYTSSKHKNSHRIVEPVTIAFKWYAWYLIAFCEQKKDFRLFCISRMRNLKILTKVFKKKEFDPEEYFKLHFNKSKDNLINLKILFDKEIKIAMETWFPNGNFEKEDESSYQLEISLPKNEQYWLGMLMSFGNKVKIIEPEYLIESLKNKVSEIDKLYHKNKL